MAGDRPPPRVGEKQARRAGPFWDLEDILGKTLNKGLSQDTGESQKGSNEEPEMLVRGPIPPATCSTLGTCHTPGPVTTCRSGGMVWRVVCGMYPGCKGEQEAMGTRY